MNYEDYRKGQIEKEVINTSEGRKATSKVLSSRINKAEMKLSALKAAHKVKDVAGYVSSRLNKRLSNRQVIKSPNKVVVVENQPIVTNDRSRFFKEAWKEEKRQLFFK